MGHHRDELADALQATGGELDVAYAASIAAQLAAVATSEREIVVDLAGLEFIDSSGVVALARSRTHGTQAETCS